MSDNESSSQQSGPSESGCLLRMWGLLFIWFGAHYVFWSWLFGQESGDYRGNPVFMAALSGILMLISGFVIMIFIACIFGEALKKYDASTRFGKAKIFMYVMVALFLFMFIGPVLRALFPTFFSGYGIFAP